MVFIHSSTHLPINTDPALTPETTTQSLRTCADSLRRIADSYSKMAEVIETKNIKISTVAGTAGIGSFEVDDIDAARLRVAGLVYDARTQPAKAQIESDPEQLELNSFDYPFFIDPAYDEMCSKIDQNLSKQLADNPEEEILPVEFSAGAPPLEKVNWEETTEDGTPSVDVKIGYDPLTGEESLNLNIVDVGAPLEEVDYDPDNQEFSYFCATCDEEHTESLEQVFNSLAVVTGMISQLQQINRQTRKEISGAFQSLEDNLRLLQFFVAMHLEDDDEDDDEDEPHDHECDHHH